MSDSEQNNTDGNGTSPELAEILGPEEKSDSVKSDTVAKKADDQKPTTAKTAKSGGRLLALLALLIAFAAAGGAGWLWWQDQQTAQDQQDDSTALRSDIQNLVRESSASSKAMDARLDKLAQQVNDIRPIAADINSLRQAQAQTKAEVDALETRHKSALQRLGAARSQWLEAEVEYLLRIAHQRLNLQGDVLTTKAALEAADGRLQALADPGFLPVREKLKQHIVKLNASNQTDITGLALTLASLSDEAAALPLPSTVPDEFKPDEPEASNEELSGWRKFAHDSWAELKSLVRVTESDGRYATLPTVEDRRVIVQTLQLKLEAAKLALLQNRNDLFRAEAASARQWISTWFDSAAPATQGALAELDRVVKADTATNYPDLAGTLRLFAKLRSNMDDAAPPAQQQNQSQPRAARPGQTLPRISPASPTQAAPATRPVN